MSPGIEFGFTAKDDLRISPNNGHFILCIFWGTNRWTWTLSIWNDLDVWPAWWFHISFFNFHPLMGTYVIQLHFFVEWGGSTTSQRVAPGLWVDVGSQVDKFEKTPGFQVAKFKLQIEIPTVNLQQCSPFFLSKSMSCCICWFVLVFLQ